MLNIPVQWICFLGNNFCFGTKNSVDYNSWLSGDKARGARGCCWLFGYKRCFVGDIDLFFHSYEEPAALFYTAYY